MKKYGIRYWLTQVRFKISDDASVKQGHWVWHGKKEADVWQIRLYLKHAPLHGLAHKIPQLFGQTWHQGFATGNVDIINDVMTADELTLEDVSFQGKDAAYLGLNELQLSHIQWDTYAQIFKAKSMDIQDGVWHFDGLDLNAQQHQASTWKVIIPNISWQGMTWQDMQHHVMLFDVYGTASWQEDHGSLSAHQTEEQGLWNIALKQAAGERLALEIEGKKVPLRLLRSLFPEALQTQGYFNGKAGFHLQGHLAQSAYLLNGNITIEDFSWQHSDGTWQAASMNLHDAELSSDHPFQVATMTIQDWKGLIPMQPWLQNSTAEAKPVLTTPFRLGDWQIGKLELTQGHLSIGQADNVWFTSESMTFSPIQPAHPIHVDIQGHIGEGIFQWQGQWSPWLPQPWFDASIHLKNALPFVAKDWLHLSGLPS
ncbi:MAG: hypothetical protein Q9M18_09475, partial [Mariprofundaceae bacterium]|nr:hypothetical protein [Mariprofundaceae bacterium]